MNPKFSERTLVVEGEVVELDVRSMAIVDIDDDMRRVAMLMAYWGAVMGAAERERDETDAFYRRWRAQKTESVLSEEPRLAEFKVRAAVEADDNFLKLKKAHAQCVEAYTTAKSMFEACGRRSNQLQSMGAKQRTELETGRKSTTPTTPRRSRPESEADPEPTVLDQQKKVRRRLKGKN